MLKSSTRLHEIRRRGHLSQSGHDERRWPIRSDPLAPENSGSLALLNSARKFKKVRCRYETPTYRESTTLGTKIDDGRALGAGSRKPTSRFRELVRSVFEATDDRGTIGRPDIIARFQVWGRAWPLY